MNIGHLLQAADRLAAQRKRPRSVDLRRAVSNAYYALFHALAGTFADRLVGVARRRSPAWTRVYRGLDHAKAKEELVRNTTRGLDPAIPTLASAFVDLQEMRYTADYDPRPFPYSRRQVRNAVTLARTAIASLEGLNADIVAELAAIILLKSRR